VGPADAKAAPCARPDGRETPLLRLDGPRVLFGSELKALRAHPAFDPNVDRDALALFLRYKYVPTPRSIYRGIAKLTPGTSLTIDPLRWVSTPPLANIGPFARLPRPGWPSH